MTALAEENTNQATRLQAMHIELQALNRMVQAELTARLTEEEAESPEDTNQV